MPRIILVQSVPTNLFKSISFDCSKEFSKWKNINNLKDIDICFADLGTHSQQRLNENLNGLLRKDRLPKHMDSMRMMNLLFCQWLQKESLDYATSFEIFLNHVNNGILSN